MTDPIPTWPATLPAPRVSGYGYKETPSFMRTTMDSGQARQRRRFITTPTAVTAQFRLTGAQLATFEAWFKDALYDGQAWAMIPVVNGLGVNAVRARFTDTPRVSGVDGASDVFDISATIETLAMPHG